MVRAPQEGLPVESHFATPPWRLQAPFLLVLLLVFPSRQRAVSWLLKSGTLGGAGRNRTNAFASNFAASFLQL